MGTDSRYPHCFYDESRLSGITCVVAGCCGRVVLTVGTAGVAVVMGTLGLKGGLVLTVVVVGGAVVGSGVLSIVVEVSSSVVVSMLKPG